MTESPFTKLHHAHVTGQNCTLTHGDVELLLDCLGDAFGKAEAEFETWRDRLAEYERDRAREAGD